MTTSTTEPRAVDGTPAPAVGTYDLDPAHTHVGFSVRHLMLARVKGRFGSVTGTVVIGEDPLDSSVEVTIAAASIDTGNDERDAHLRSPDFFDADEHPEITFVSTGIRPSAAPTFEVDGLLTIKGVTQPVMLVAIVEGVGADPESGTQLAGFSAAATVDREHWGLTFDPSGMFISRAVTLEIEAEITRR